MATPSRALERQLERSLAWRCSQTVAHQPKGSRDRRLDAAAAAAAAAPGGSGSGPSEKADFGAAQLCRGLLDQCDLCADSVRSLCTAVSNPGGERSRSGLPRLSRLRRRSRSFLARLVLFNTECGGGGGGGYFRIVCLLTWAGISRTSQRGRRFRCWQLW